VLIFAVAAANAKASGAIAFEGHVEGAGETLAGHLVLGQGRPEGDQFILRSSAGIDCVGPMIQKAGVLQEAVLQCSDGRTGLIKLRIYGQNVVTEATLDGQKLVLSMPNHPHHRSR
jgi:hypothetical protein